MQFPPIPRFLAIFHLGSLVVAAGFIWIESEMARAGETQRLETRAALRRPIALRLSDDEKFLYVAHRDGGNLSVIDLGSRSVVAETPIGTRLSDFVSLANGRFLATDETAHELILIEAQGADVAVKQRLKVAPFPVAVAIASDSKSCAVSSLWSRRLTLVGLEERTSPVADTTMRVMGDLDTPFAPRCLTYVRDNRFLIVADAFAGRLAIVDPKSRQLRGVRQFPGHNIRGLATSPNGSMLLVAHQMLNELAHTVRNDVHWGLLMSNDLRWLKLDSVLDLEGDLYAGAHMHPLGQAGGATGDPSGLAVASNGTVFVATGGVGEISTGTEDDFNLTRLSVGKRPTALVVDRAGKLVYVANTFSDSVSIVSVEDREAIAEISLGPQRQLSLREQGELLFYDARVSHDGWMSCHSCHTDGHTNGLINDNLSDKSFGSAKQVLTLLGKQGTEPFAWNASAADLPTQIRSSIANTMQGSETPPESDIAALVAFVESLEPPPSIDVLRGTEDPAAIARGRLLFEKEGCVRCHAPPRFTTPQTYDVGLVDKQGQREFNPPSLLGVGQRGPYFHDNSAATLEDVLHTSSHQLERALSDAERGDLIAFLRSL